MDPISFRAAIRHWKPEKASGLAVVEIPAEHVAAIGGLKQQRVRGTVDGTDFASNVMPAGGGRLALSVSKAMMSLAGATVGDEVEINITSVGRDG